jgi:hypothetical protein
MTNTIKVQIETTRPLTAEETWHLMDAVATLVEPVQSFPEVKAVWFSCSEGSMHAPEENVSELS